MSLMPIFVPLVYPNIEFAGSVYTTSGISSVSATTISLSGAQASANRRIFVISHFFRTNSDGADAPNFSSANFDNGSDQISVTAHKVGSSGETGFDSGHTGLIGSALVPTNDYTTFNMTLNRSANQGAAFIFIAAHNLVNSTPTLSALTVSQGTSGPNYSGLSISAGAIRIGLFAAYHSSPLTMTNPTVGTLMDNDVYTSSGNGALAATADYFSSAEASESSSATPSGQEGYAEGYITWS